MAPTRKLTGPSAAAEAYPTGAVLLGALRDVVNVPLVSTTARTSARVAAGDTVDERSVVQLCRALAEAFVDKQVVPPLSAGNAWELLTLAIYTMAKKWDLATAPLRIGEARPVDWRMMTMGAAQLFVVELGIRAGAWLAVAPSTLDVSSLAIPDRATIMNGAIKATNLSQGALARALGVAETTIVRWKKGESRPDERQLDELGKQLGPEAIAGLRRSLALTAIVDRLAAQLPEHLVSDLWAGLLRISATSRAFHVSRPREDSVRTIVFGSEANPELVPLLLGELTENEFHWRAPIDSALDWAARLEFVHGVAWRAARTDLPAEVGEIVFWKAFSEATPAIAQVAESLARIHPGLASQCTAARQLFEAAVARRQRRIADAVRHLQQAHAELPDDPGTTRAVIDGMLRAGEPDEAILRTVNTPDGIAEARRIWAAKQVAADQIEAGLAEFEALLREGDTHPEMYLYVGVTRFRVGDVAGALDALERVVADKRFEFHALALEIAAMCAFELGKNKRGDELARRANQVGVSGSYWWRRITSTPPESR